MARICNSRAKVYETIGVVFDEPVDHVESEGERLIKQMVHKQLDTHTSLHLELKREKNFKSVAEILPLTEYVCGEKSLEEFEKSAEKAAHIEEWKSLGLSKDEIQILLNYERDGFSERYKKIEKSIFSAHLQNALEKVEEAKKLEQNAQNSSSTYSRHERELGLCVKPESEYTKLLSFVLSCQQTKDARPPDHPINHLKDIEEDLFGHLVKRQKISTIHKTKEKPAISNEILPSTYSYKNGISLWDVTPKQNNDETLSKDKAQLSNHIYTCKPEYLYTVKNGEIIPTVKSQHKKKFKDNVKNNGEYVVSDMGKSSISLVPLENISKNRLSLQEIRSIPKFSDYLEGNPTQVLYVKNLAGNATKDDLVSLFGHFQSNNETRILYRLMTGRMKGQAFITFSSMAHAEEALNVVNGYVLKGKPLIIQYGKGKTKSDPSSCH